MPRCSASTPCCRPISTGWRPLVDAGKLRLLMVWTSARSPNFPNVPTLKELGYPMVYDSPFGIAGPKGMDPKIVAKLHDAFKKALDDPAVIATLAKFDMVPNYKNTEDYKKFVVEVTNSELKVIETLGLAKKNELDSDPGNGVIPRASAIALVAAAAKPRFGEPRWTRAPSRFSGLATLRTSG